MYLFNRSRHVNSASVREGVAAAVEVAGMASTITGFDISAWMTVASRDVGLISWSAMFESLDDLAAANQKLAESSEYGDWIDAHDALFEGRAEDGLSQLVHGAPDPERTVNFVSATTAVCVNGKLSAAMAAGVEFAELASKITAPPTIFAAYRTGLYGGVMWLSAGETLGELEQGEAALSADPAWVQLLDQHGPLFGPGVETALFQRLG
jgi:hypothetical protein